MYRNLLEKLIYALTILLLVFPPIPIGSVKPLSSLLIQFLAFLLFIFWLLWSMYEKEKIVFKTRNYLPLSIFLLICLFQIIPLPDVVIRIVSEKSLDIWEQTQLVVSSIGFSEKKSMYTISLYPHATWRETILLLSYIAFGIVVSRYFKTKRKITMLLLPVFAILLYEASYGIYQYLISGGAESASGTFVNRNHFAGFIEMTFPLVLGFALSLSDVSDSKKISFFKQLISSDHIYRQILILFMLAIMLLALILSKSRMGILSAFVSVIFFYLIYSKFTLNILGRAWMIYLIISFIIFFGFLIGFYPIIERYLLVDMDLPSRTLVWKDMMRIIEDFPLFGTGLGTFRYVYPLYKKSIELPLVYLYAHNDYLQLIVETGILGFLSIMSALIIYLYTSFKDLMSLNQKKEYFRFFLLLGALTGIVSILIHSLSDFNLHIPSNGLYFAFLVGFSKAIGRK